ncbi:MAG: serine/threonine-protein kinase, partial [Chloroflexota bacterium]
MDYAQLAGRTLGQYELKSLIGKGGMSAVYRAHQPSLNRNVAVKVLSKDLATDPTYAVRFDNEAKTVATLEHNNIIPVYDYGREDDLSFIVMRLLTGGTLGERVERRVDTGAPLPSFGECVTLLREMTKALSYAHGRGVIHRDIKASNVMFDGQGDPYLVDFGIAQVMKANLSLTMDNQTIGTPTYMAPEQWRDEDLTPATDQYALAILMYYMLTSHLPFYGTNSPALMQKHLNEEIPAPQRYRADIPEEAGTVLARGMAKQSDDRFVNVTAFTDSFEVAFKGMSGEKTGFFTFALGNLSLKTDP